ncbi:MAG: c-type cytochrome [Thermodesulfobacteriota bacterium]
MKNVKYYAILILLLCLSGASKAGAFPWNFDMYIQPSILPYEEPIAYPQLSVSTTGLRIEPLPREDFEKITENPVPATEESLKRGEHLFNTYCFVCHGKEGKGDGPVIKRGFYPMNLTSPAVIARTNGYIYAYIRYGGKVMMPSYRENITSHDAWNIVNYVRKLQGSPKTEQRTNSQDKNKAEETAQ